MKKSFIRLIAVASSIILVSCNKPEPWSSFSYSYSSYSSSNVLELIDLNGNNSLKEEINRLYGSNSISISSKTEAVKILDALYLNSLYPSKSNTTLKSFNYQGSEGGETLPNIFNELNYQKNEDVNIVRNNEDKTVRKTTQINEMFYDETKEVDGFKNSSSSLIEENISANEEQQVYSITTSFDDSSYDSVVNIALTKDGYENAINVSTINIWLDSFKSHQKAIEENNKYSVLEVKTEILENVSLSFSYVAEAIFNSSTRSVYKFSVMIDLSIDNCFVNEMKESFETIDITTSFVTEAFYNSTNISL